ncbi:HNH endonuclease [Gluconobacter cerinus]|uniref:HNH endonuclease n=1 Tax=Gluconobacter TaxID=441 RepID=UPI001B8C2B01|nr:HNH endonuclease [Gluconobacter oxydans]MBS1032532.1 HNH endonuclease [Gluconobacter cerinus]MBS1104080.1 HNH endonuclease [Gluconobacter sp. Dm-62]
MSAICAICGQGIAPADDSKEHILPNAIGGRRTVNNFLHGDCNNRAGQTWDAELEKQLRPLALHIGIKRQNGKTSRMKVTTTANEDFLLDVGGQLEMVRPVVMRTLLRNDERIDVTAGSFTQARETLKGLKRKYPKVDMEAILVGAESQRSYAMVAIDIDLSFGGPLSGRSLVKSALALAHHAGLPIEACGDAISYLRKTDAEPCFRFYDGDDLVDGRPQAMPLHCVAIDANPATGLILGYVEYFGIHRIVVCLGRDYVCNRLQSVYALDPRTGGQLQVAVHIDLDAEDIRAIYNCERVNEEKRLEAAGAILGSISGAQHTAEGEHVVRESLDFAWANCGGVPGQPLTTEHLERLKELFVKRSTPWWKHVTGLDEAAACQFAFAYIENVLATA